MKGRSRALTARNPPGKSALSIAFNDRCDMIVAIAVIPRTIAQRRRVYQRPQERIPHAQSSAHQQAATGKGGPKPGSGDPEED
jgi:hypothetical protein